MGCRLYVGSLNYDVTEEHIRKIFQAIAPLKAVDMSFEPAYVVQSHCTVGSFRMV